MADNDKRIADLCRKHNKISKRGLAQQYNNTEACQSFYNGDMMTYEDKIQFSDAGGRRRRATVNFNSVQSNVDSVVGFMAQNRRQAKYIARVPDSQDQQLYSKNMNSLYDFHRENQNADQIETEQDADMMIIGFGATETDMSYLAGNSTTDPNGEIIKVRLDPRVTSWDPAAKDKNLLSARWVDYYDDFELKDALALFQGSEESDFQQVSDEQTDRHGYVYNPYGGLYDKIKMEDTVEWSAKEENMVRVHNHQWFEYETFYKAKNPVYQATDPLDAMFMKSKMDIIKDGIDEEGPDGIAVNDMFAFNPDAEEITFDAKTKSKLMREFGDLIKPVAFKRKCFYTAVISGDHVFTWFKSICQQGFTVKFKTGIYSETQGVWMGMVNAMMEPQKYKNKALTELLFTISANSKGGVMVEEDAVEDVSDFESKYAKTDAVIIVRSGALSGGKIMPKSQGAVPTGLENIITLTEQSIATNGVDPSFMGNTQDDQSGIFYKRRIRQCLSKMARYFDSITLYQKEDARLHADFIPVWVENNNGQWVQITGPDGSKQFQQITQDSLAPSYDVSIQEAAQTPEDKQETAAILGSYGDKLILSNPPAAMAFYTESLQMLPLDGDVRSRLTQTLQRMQQPPEDPRIQQMQQVINQLQSQVTQAEVDNKQSATALNMQKIEESKANSQSKMATTTKTLEEAANKGLENDLVRSGSYDKVSVMI